MKRPKGSVGGRIARTATAAVPSLAAACEEGSGTTVGGGEAVVRRAIGRCPGSGPGRDVAAGMRLAATGQALA